MATMAGDDGSSIQTRPSHLNRLRQGDDNEGWQEFYRVYGKLVRDFAIRAGLTDTEADEVVQETAISMARHLPEYRYDPKVCRFKTWLLNQATWRIKDQLKKRKKTENWNQSLDTATAAIHCLADPASIDLDALFEGEYRKNLLALAMERVKDMFQPKQLQIYDLLFFKEWPAKAISQSLGVSLANVYVTRHRISAAIKREVERLENQFEKAGHRRMQQAAERDGAE